MDEVDCIIFREFEDQVMDISERLPQGKQVVLFSSTMPVDAQELTKKLTRNPVLISSQRDELAFETLKSFHSAASAEDMERRGEPT